MTKEQAINVLVDQDCAEWGEQERAAARRAHERRSHGSALNEVANRAELAGSPDLALRAEAIAVLTASDWAILRQGG